MINDTAPLNNSYPDDNDSCCGINLYKIKKATIMIRALNHPLRKSIITTLQQREKINVTDLYSKLGMEQSILSQHLAVLRRTGVISQKRTGKFIYYSINKKGVEKIDHLLRNFVG